MNPNENNPTPSSDPTPVPSTPPPPTPAPSPTIPISNQPDQPVFQPEANPDTQVTPSFQAANTPVNQPTSVPSPFDTANVNTNPGSSSGSQQTSPSEDPGKTLGVVGFVMSLVGFGLISLILSIIARKKSKQAGHSNGFALAGIIISTITILVSFVIAALLVFGGIKAAEYCQENGSTVQNADGSTTVNCSAGTDTSLEGSTTEGSSNMQLDTLPEGSGSMETDTTPVTLPATQ